MVQRGHDLLVDIVLIGWWWGKWESALSISWLQLVWVYVLVGNMPFISPIHWEFQYLQDSPKVFLGVSLEREPGPFPKAALLCLLTVPPLSVHPLTYLIDICLNLSHWNSGKIMEAEWSLFPVIKKWGAEKGFCAWEPHRVLLGISSVQFSSVAQLCPTLCNPMDCSTPGFPVHHQFPEFTQTHVYWVGDAIQPSHPMSSTSPAFNLSQQQGLFKESVLRITWPKYWSFSFSNQSFQWTLRTDLL